METTTGEMPTSEVLGEISALLDVVDHNSRGLASDSERLDLLRCAVLVSGRCTALTQQLAAEVAATQAAEHEHGTSATTWLAHTTRLTPREAAALLFAGRDLTSYQALTTATLTGERVSEFTASLQEKSGRMASLGMPANLGVELDALLTDSRDTGASLTTLMQRLQAATAELAKLRVELDQAKVEATLDSLTGVSNRRGFDEAMAALLREHPSGEAGPSVVLIDLDHFKQINDRHSHQAGDAVLKACAERMRATLPENALLGRWGGEEFMLLFPNCRRDLAIFRCERIRRAIAGRVPFFADGEPQQVTLSFGVAELDAEHDRPERLVSLADQRLYQAKNAGRNCIC